MEAKNTMRLKLKTFDAAAFLETDEDIQEFLA